jgi:hypothetical protein
MDVSEYEYEPIRGLPGNLPAGEHILWQGSPDAWAFARSALATRWIAGYFAALVVWAMVRGTLMGAAITAGLGAVAVALALVFAVLVARTTVYTITNRRVVLRIGVALSKCINLPLSQLGSADLRARGNGFGDIALVPIGRTNLGYAMLWPHARPLRLAAPQPMLRAVPAAIEVAGVLAKATAAITPVQQRTEQVGTEPARAKPVLGAMGAAT